MDDLKLDKRFDTQEIVTELFKQNLYLQAQVKSLFHMVGDLYERGAGLPREKTAEIFLKTSEEYFQESIEESEWFKEMWQEKLKYELGGIPGIDLGGPVPAPYKRRGLLKRLTNFVKGGKREE
jgi:hypothetical protein